MFGFSMGEILLLAVIALVVIGPKQLPEFARQIGRILNEIKRAANDFTHEIKEQTRVDLEEKKPAAPPPAAPNPATPPAAPASNDDYMKHISVDGFGHSNEASTTDPKDNKGSST